MSRLSALIFVLMSVVTTGCDHLLGKPGPEAPRPDQVLDFATLYHENCSACHGANGKSGAAIALANPMYLAWAGENNLRQITTNGVPNTLMPGFGKTAGGLLTDQQIENLVQGMLTQWGQPEILSNQNAPSYRANAEGDAALGKQAFGVFCSKCHSAGNIASAAGASDVGSITDPTYLALISAQGLRSTVVVGMPDNRMPDWRQDLPGRAMTDKEVTDVVTWLVSQRIEFPGQPFAPSHSE